MKTIRDFFKRTFCFHNWKTDSSELYNILDNTTGKVIGEVRLSILECSKCGEMKILPTDKKINNGK